MRAARLRLWIVCPRARAVMVPGFVSNRRARIDARALAARGLTVQIRERKKLLREVYPPAGAP